MQVKIFGDNIIILFNDLMFFFFQIQLLCNLDKIQIDFTNDNYLGILSHLSGSP